MADAQDHDTSSSSSIVAGRIQRLSTEVVNRIAAGEVVHRPVNALKELLENSLDAGATQISVTVSQGGLKLLQIQDNGRGIQREDLEIVCERFTTSKLSKFEDLRAISSFGFRGEALASISHVAHVTITSKTASQPCAYKAHYRDSKLVAKRPGGSSDPAPCAGKIGTQIVVEDLFYNLSTRKQALKNTSEQYQRILEVVQKYAIQYGSKHVGFVCKKYREPSCDVNTMQVTTQLDVLRSIYGSKLAAELLPFAHEKDASSSALSIEYKARGYVSNANYKRRLVDSPSLKKACEYVYSLYLPKHTHPFVYLSLELPPHDIDVNVHPTKREVHFLHEEEIVDALSQAIEKQLKGSNESRSFSVQPITSMMGISTISSYSLTTTNASLASQSRRAGGLDEEDDDDGDEEEGKRNEDDDDDHGTDEDTRLTQVMASQAIEVELSQKSVPASKKYNPLHAPQRLVRTDFRSNTIDKYFFLESQRSQPDPSQSPPPQQQKRQSSSRAAIEEEEEISSLSEDEDDGAERSSGSKKRKLDLSLNDPIDLSQAEPEPEGSSSDDRRSSVEATQSPRLLSSVQNLLNHVERKKSKSLDRLFREHTFVGVVNKQYSLVQFRTKLYVVKHQEVAYRLFYERVLRKFGALRPIKLETPLSIYELVVEALANPRNGYDDEDGPREQLAEEIKTLLASNGPMLAEYFSLDIDAQGMLRSLPRLLADHEPSIHSLPEFVFQLATEVNWEEEEACFESVAQVLAHWYAELRYPAQGADKTALVLEHVVFPATKRAEFSPPHELNDASIITPVACLTKLYKIFERC